MNDAAASNHVLLTTDDIRQWEENVRALTAEIEELNSRLASLTQRIEYARVLFPDAVSVAARPSPKSGPAEQPVAPAGRVHKGRRPSVLEPWEQTILEFVGRFDRGCTYAQLRSHLLESELGDDLRNGTKSYERSMHNLAGRGAIERGYGRVFTPAAFAAFEIEAKASGIPPNPLQFARSPMGEAILRIVYDCPGLTNRQIMNELRKDVEFDAALTPNEGTAYNIMARLARRGNIVKRDDGGAFPGPNFPHDLLGLPAQREGASNGTTADAPFNGEGATSPNESQGRFDSVLG